MPRSITILLVKGKWNEAVSWGLVSLCGVLVRWSIRMYWVNGLKYEGAISVDKKRRKRKTNRKDQNFRKCKNKTGSRQTYLNTNDQSCCQALRIFAILILHSASGGVTRRLQNKIQNDVSWRRILLEQHSYSGFPQLEWGRPIVKRDIVGFRVRLRQKRNARLCFVSFRTNLETGHISGQNTKTLILDKLDSSSLLINSFFWQR